MMVKRSAREDVALTLFLMVSLLLICNLMFLPAVELMAPKLYIATAIISNGVILAIYLGFLVRGNG
ncbi:MAG: hypothetical protein ACTSU5_20060 [Promethearchaeota archaeon]